MAKDFKQTSQIADARGKLRLYVNALLGAGVAVAASDGQAHYLLHVMRAKTGQGVLLFNGQDGEWLSEIVTAKRGVTLRCLKQTQAQAGVPDLWLLFAPVKKTPADYLVQKATELGASKLQPVFTRRTVVTRVNPERLLSNAVEAAEQSGRLCVPEIGEAASLEKIMTAWSKDRRLFYCDEGGDAKPLAPVAASGPVAILTGPEGGFDPAEREALRALPFVTPVTLGPRILRADTAALAALAIWQSVKGDWA
jgi:16S rRNA (uracil1498-N3)-methyltransferase